MDNGDSNKTIQGIEILIKFKINLWYQIKLFRTKINLKYKIIIGKKLEDLLNKK